MDSLSKVIGFAEVTNTRMTFKKATNEVGSILKSKNYDNDIGRREGQIITQFNERIISDEQYINKINDVIRPLELGINITKFEDIDTLLSLFKKTDDSVIIEKRAFLSNTLNVIKDFQDRIDKLLVSYDIYYQAFQKIVQNIETLKKMSLSNLLTEGLGVLKGSIIEKEECPLCLQAKSRAELMNEIGLRLKTLDSVRKEKSQLDEAKNIVRKTTTEMKNSITGIQSNKYYNLPENQKIMDFCKTVIKHIELLECELNVDILQIQRIKTKEELVFDTADLKTIIDFCQKSNESLEKQIRGKRILEIQDKITLSRQAYYDIKKLKKEKQILEKQKGSLEIIYNAFVQKQKGELETFVNSFSKEINDYYQYLHPGEKVDNIEIKTTEKDDELTGISVDFYFFNKEVSPPQKYLSESHLNSLGIAFFLASVKAFNKNNEFFILDDLISSFDSNHRKRLGDMLLDKFSDYQIFVMTHERNWFDYMRNLVKSRSDWVVNAVNWSELTGTHFNETLVDLRKTIEKNSRIMI